MINKTAILLSLSPIPLLVAVEYFLKRRHKKQLKTIKNQKFQNNYYYHCLFFYPKDNCRQHLINNSPCDENCSSVYVKKLSKFVRSARKSISMCMYHFTLRQVGAEVINAYKRGVAVRLIGDKVTSSINHTQFQYLHNRYGIQYKIPYLENSFMHHKFCLIDAEDPNLAKMFLGSLNLTSQGLVSNYEFMLLTNDKEIIEIYNNEFTHLWNQFKIA